jgi:hypothetical protein
VGAVPEIIFVAQPDVVKSSMLHRQCGMIMLANLLYFLDNHGLSSYNIPVSLAAGFMQFSQGSVPMA